MRKFIWSLAFVVLLCAVVGLFNVHAQVTINPPPGNGWVQIASGLTVLTYVDSTCKDGTTCYYAVESADQFGVGLDTTYVTAAIPATGTHTVTLTWTASTTPNVTYTLFQGPPPVPAAGLAAVTN